MTATSIDNFHVAPGHHGYIISHAGILYCIVFNGAACRRISGNEQHHCFSPSAMLAPQLLHRQHFHAKQEDGGRARQVLNGAAAHSVSQEAQNSHYSTRKRMCLGTSLKLC